MKTGQTIYDDYCRAKFGEPGPKIADPETAWAQVGYERGLADAKAELETLRRGAFGEEFPGAMATAIEALESLE